MTSNQVNIFKYATSELSHDAILCYILSSYAADEEERTVSRRMLAAMIAPDRDLNCLLHSKIKTIEIEKQFPVTENSVEKSKEKIKGFIDILVKVEFDNDNEKYALIIEDKIHTFDHGNQLQKYQNYVSKSSDLKDFSKIYVFVTLGLKSLKYFDQINKRNSDRNKWNIIDREAITKIVERYKGSKVSIIGQYRDFLLSLNNNSSMYSFKPVKDWSDEMSQNFFMTLENEKSRIDEIDGWGWGFVNNQSGGFQGYWYNKSDILKYSIDGHGIKYFIYQQLEFSKTRKRVALKISFDLENNKIINKKDKIRIKIANEITSDLKIEKDSDSNHHKREFKKTIIREGNYMTIGEFVFDDDIDFKADDVRRSMIDLNRLYFSYLKFLNINDVTG